MTKSYKKQWWSEWDYEIYFCIGLILSVLLGFLVGLISYKIRF